ncbi:hypothetical protein K2X05_08140, partial [bacterium]|nr:hypothetical protein [bacterium]
YEKPEVLLHLGSPLRGVPLSDKNIYQKVTSRQSVNLSLIGEMQIYAKALEKVSTTLISAKDKATFAQTLQQFLISFAEHTRHYGWVSEPTALDSIPIPVNKEGFPANPDLFARTVAETLFGNTYLQKGERMNGLQVQLDDLSSIVVGLKFFDLTDVYSTLDKTPEQVSKMSQDEYKKYTVLQILHHMNLVIEESNDYYDRYLFLTGLFNLTNNKK